MTLPRKSLVTLLSATVHLGVYLQETKTTFTFYLWGEFIWDLFGKRDIRTSRIVHEAYCLAAYSYIHVISIRESPLHILQVLYFRNKKGVSKWHPFLKERSNFTFSHIYMLEHLKMVLSSLLIPEPLHTYHSTIIQISFSHPSWALELLWSLPPRTSTTWFHTGHQKCPTPSHDRLRAARYCVTVSPQGFFFHEDFFSLHISDEIPALWYAKAKELWAETDFKSRCMHDSIILPSHVMRETLITCRSQRMEGNGTGQRWPWMGTEHGSQRARHCCREPLKTSVTCYQDRAEAGAESSRISWNSSYHS